MLLHGRDGAGRDPDQTEATWLAALNTGLEAIGSPRRLADDDATFVFFGDTLAAFTGGTEPPPITTHALPGMAEEPGRFALAVAREILAEANVLPEPGSAVGPEFLTGEFLWAALMSALAAIDRFVPGVSGTVVLLLARDVHTYLHDADARATVDAGVAEALPRDEPAVVVAHSLGAVIAYEVLRSSAPGRDVPLLVTLGAPLAIRAVRTALERTTPLGWPEPVGRWVAVRDPRDLLTLHDLTPSTFLLDPPGPGIENVAVDNPVPGRHAAATEVDGRPAGYLATPPVARAVDAALGVTN